MFLDKNLKSYTRLLFFLSLLIILIIFCIAGTIAYQKFNNNAKENEKLARPMIEITPKLPQTTPPNGLSLEAE